MSIEATTRQCWASFAFLLSKNQNQNLILLELCGNSQRAMWKLRFCGLSRKTAREDSSNLNSSQYLADLLGREQNIVVK